MRVVKSKYHKICPRCKGPMAYCARLCQSCRYDVPLAGRFLSKINFGKNCWLWTGTKGYRGYGRFYIKKKGYAAHRIAYQMFKGRIPKGLSVCHSCDNCGCVRPEHLWLGTGLDNTHDAVSKGRLGKGLTPKKAKIIRQLYRKGIFQYKIAKKFKVHQSNISLICANKIWKED